MEIWDRIKEKFPTKNNLKKEKQRLLDELAMIDPQFDKEEYDEKLSAIERIDKLIANGKDRALEWGKLVIPGIVTAAGYVIVYAISEEGHLPKTITDTVTRKISNDRH